jgi:hypothetical protein
MTITKNPLLSALIVLQITTLCFVTLLFFKSPAQQDTLERSLMSDNNGSTGDSAAPTGGLETELRAMRAEIAALRSAAGVPAPVISDAATPPSEQELQAQTLAFNNSSLIIQSAVSAGVWTRADTKALLPHIGRTNDQQRMALVAEFYDAINRQELRLEDSPPL